jgi:hypothetical protein
MRDYLSPEKEKELELSVVACVNDELKDSPFEISLEQIEKRKDKVRNDLRKSLLEDQVTEDAMRIIDFLGIRRGGHVVNVVEIVTHLMDDKKFAALSSKIKNKAFW